MKKWIVGTVLGIIVVALLVHIIVVIQTPYIAMDMAEEKFDIERNTLAHTGPPDENSREVVRPSPDLVYSICVYDVGENAILFTAPVPNSYWSISGYAEDTHNFFTVNNKDVKSNPARVLVVGEEIPQPDSENLFVKEAPSDTGIILIRMFVPDRDNIENLVQIQQEATVETIPPDQIPEINIIQED